MSRLDHFLGGVQLAARTAGSFARIAGDALGDRLGTSLPATRDALATPEAIDALVHDYTPHGVTPLPRVVSATLPGVDFESSNCSNFLVELAFSEPRADLPKTVYAKLPCAELSTRTFANALGFWALETRFCARVASHVPIRVPRVHVAAQQGSRFVLLLENLHEIPGARLFVNRDMAAGTTPERAERVLRAFAELHAHFHGWAAAEREALLPAGYDVYRGPHWRGVTRALNAVGLARAHEAAPDLVPARLVETCRLALDRWDAVLEAWYRGPLTLVHGDSHLGNCFEYPGEGGPRVGMIDFQAVHWSKGMRDVQYFLIHSLEPDVLEANEAALIRGYCDALAGRGVALGFDDAYAQYRAFSYQTLMAGVVPLGLSALTERSETLLTATRRSAAAVERLRFREWVEGL